ncbi:MAG TPA: hypothetical protein VNU66_09745 [Mycobacteriales bacterium]|nr:hypothetical protein [Mycobacteriales bacterium]
MTDARRLVDKLWSYCNVLRDDGVSTTGAHVLAGQLVESNRRQWTNESHLAPSGLAVVTLTHPRRANWRSPDEDPTALVRRALDRWTNAS